MLALHPAFIPKKHYLGTGIILAKPYSKAKTQPTKMNLFLRAKHWQLFLLTFGIPMVLYIIVMAGIFSNIMHHPNQPPDPREIFGYFKLFPFIMVLFTGTLLGWEYSVAVGLQKIVPAHIKMKVTKFKTFFFIPVTYLSLIVIFIFVILTTNFSHTGAADFGPLFFIPFLIIIPIHLFSMFCLFYCLYFVAKTLKTVELQREVSFNDFIAEFFLTWFFPIGVWILQPRINKMIKEYDNKDENTSQD